MTTFHYRVISFDVWGNAIDGWDINDARYAGFLEVSSEDPTGPTEDDVRAALVSAGYVRADIDPACVGVEYEDRGGEEYDSWFITDDRDPGDSDDYGNGKPAYRLEPSP